MAGNGEKRAAVYCLLIFGPRLLSYGCGEVGRNEQNADDEWLAKDCFRVPSLHHTLMWI
jgi:hypothetical protein